MNTTRLYTEEQVIHAIKMARSSTNIFTTPFIYDKDEILEKLKPMEQQTNHIGDTNKMVTAVEWLYEHMSDKQPNWLYVIDTKEYVQKLWEQAKQMEKEQIKETYDVAYQHGCDHKEITSGNIYYNETYKK